MKAIIINNIDINGSYGRDTDCLIYVCMIPVNIINTLTVDTIYFTEAIIAPLKVVEITTYALLLYI